MRFSFHLHFVTELKVDRCTDVLVVSQHCCGYHRGAQNRTQIPTAHTFILQLSILRQCMHLQIITFHHCQIKLYIVYE